MSLSPSSWIALVLIWGPCVHTSNALAGNSSEQDTLGIEAKEAAATKTGCHGRPGVDVIKSLCCLELLHPPIGGLLHFANPGESYVAAASDQSASLWGTDFVCPSNWTQNPISTNITKVLASYMMKKFGHLPLKLSSAFMLICCLHILEAGGHQFASTVHMQCDTEPRTPIARFSNSGLHFFEGKHKKCFCPIEGETLIFPLIFPN